MTRGERMAEARDFYTALAAELDSHTANGSGFIFLDRDGDDASDEVVKLRLGILRRLVASLERKAGRR